ncbi:MAG: rRNA (cytidine-2-O)-methyltransferase TlyA, partial [Pseudomonadota bacterium]
MRADQLLVERGLAASRSQAQRLIAAGLRWRLGAGAWKSVAKNGDEISEAAELQLADAAESRYVSRGGLKLEGALQRTGQPVAGLRCLDVGQSTGGFTDCLLQQGAAQVIGVDVGHGQLNARLRADPRVLCVEKLNARELDAQALLAAGGEPAAPPFDLIVGDLSFISQTLVWPALQPLLAPQGHL